MSAVTRKTEIEPLDGTPEKRMFWSIIADYDLQTGLTELVDNAIDIWMGTKNRGPLRIDLNLDAERQIIALTDNAGGVRHEDLRLLITPGGTKNPLDAETIGIFGVGSKRAAVALAENVLIKTHHDGDRSFQIDITKEWIESSGWEFPAYEIPEITAGSTEIELSQLRKTITVGDEELLRRHFGEVYEWFLQIDDCRIAVNGVDVVPIAFDSWAFPPEFLPRSATFVVSPDGEGQVSIDVEAGLIRDRDPVAENYGVYIYCNNRLVVKELKNREVGYFVGSEAGVPHPDASLCRVIVRINGAAKLMPWNSSKTGINYGHTCFVQIRPTLIQLVSYFSSLSRRLKDDWPTRVFRYGKGEVQQVPPEQVGVGQKLILPQLPRVQKPHAEQLRAQNRDVIEAKPWTLGLVEAVAAVDIIARQRLQTRNRIALVLLDSNFEIALKEFIVHRTDLFDPRIYDDSKISALFGNRHKVISEVISKFSVDSGLLERARHYYVLRNKLIHERATVGVTDDDVSNYRSVIEQVLAYMFQLKF